MQALGLLRDKLTITQLKTRWVPLKQYEEKAVSTKKAELQRRLVEWEARGSLSVDKEVINVVRAATNELKQTGNDESVEDVEQHMGEEET